MQSPGAVNIDGLNQACGAARGLFTFRVTMLGNIVWLGMHVYYGGANYLLHNTQYRTPAHILLLNYVYLFIFGFIFGHHFAFIER